MTQYQEITQTRFIDFKTQQIGDVLVEDGVFVRTEKNKYNGLNFLFKTASETVSISCGSLKYNYDQGNIKEGMIFKIVYDGEGVMKKGPFAGKPFHQVKIFAKGDTFDKPEDENKLPY